MKKLPRYLLAPLVSFSLAACGDDPKPVVAFDATEADIGADGQIHSPAIQKRIEMVVQLALPHLPE